MAKVYLEDSELTAIGNAIRNKNGQSTKYLPSEMPDAILSIEGGGAVDNTVYLSSPNVSKDKNATISGIYANNLNYVEVARIKGAKKLEIKLKYSTESTSYDWICVWAGNFPSYTPSSNYSSAITPEGLSSPKIGGGSNSSSFTNEVTIVVEGEYVTIGMKTDSSQGYAGYHATITEWTGQLSEEEILAPFLVMPSRSDYLFYMDRFRTAYLPYHDKLDWSKVRYMSYMFQGCSGDWSEWHIEVNNAQFWYPFSGAKGLKYPHIKVNNYDSNGAMEVFGSTCGSNRESDATCHNVELAPISPGYTARGFMNYCGLRFVPNSFYTFIGHNDTYTGSLSSGQSNPYYNTFYGARCVEEILNVPLWTAATVSSTNMLYNNQRLRRFTFETQPNGTPYTCANWTITLDFTNNFGYSASTSGSGYGQGFSSTKNINSAATYASLKDDPERLPQTAEYSDYGHDSALETIKSLPIVKSGTLKMKGTQGASTDQGAISNLTSAEIAIATAKNWTVTIS